MIPKQAIERAIAGGWGGFGWGEGKWSGSRVPGIESNHWRDIALDKDFWQALGKALGWLTCDCEQKTCAARWWLTNAQNFNTCILTGGDTDAFWRELIK